ncbi:GSCOCG00009772001-RA-CDS [Cotesia congregata]|uniref:Similar to Dipk1c: Divergent protein kinase domain 1C (Mus musculus) n=1 Tax=Cotesia congregata TaxID=51543 RepID=A0A8J2HCI9_COTCN|nr:GSCOCG00009772001-RA-CDS [Cotesia congregata]CAG5088479.1 Similar to Dipk1c: Divergent protein kinase domain 1C (Mus musculus) [Cotesia congregata]
MNIRRIPGFIYHHKYLAGSFFFTLIFIIYLLYHWGIICTNLKARRQVSELCTDYKNGMALGVLCEPLCSKQSIHSFNCENLHSGKDLVFSAYWETTRIIFKASKKLSPSEQYESLHWIDTLGNKHYPSEKEFEKMISDLVFTRLNITIGSRQLERLAHLRLGHLETEERRRNFEMENIWSLLQENEYLISILYEDREIFPRLIGTCGTFYAVEYAKPIKNPTTSSAILESTHDWSKRVQLAIMILDLLDELENNFPESFILCDVKIYHFGLPIGSQRLKFLDLDAVFPKSIANRLTADGQSCIKNEDCDYFDCKSVCSNNKLCESPVINDNLQITCEKVFLGWSIIIPGLLISRKASDNLTSLLKECANLEREISLHNLSRTTVSSAIKTKLYDILTDMVRRYTTAT